VTEGRSSVEPVLSALLADLYNQLYISWAVWLVAAHLQMSNLSKVVTQWLEVDYNLQPSGCKAQDLPLHNHCFCCGAK